MAMIELKALVKAAPGESPLEKRYGEIPILSA